MRTIEIVFWGLFLFWQQGDGTYRVLIPDGRQAPQYGIPEHKPVVDLRPKGAKPATDNWGQWQKEVKQNEYTIDEPCGAIEITGLAGIPPSPNSDFIAVLPKLTNATPPFELAPNPNSMGELLIKEGKLTSHQWDEGMVVSRWTVQVKDGDTVTIKCGQGHTLAVSDKTRQILFRNAALHQKKDENHFVIYRVLSTSPNGTLAYTNPTYSPNDSFAIIDGDPPTHSMEMTPKSGKKSAGPLGSKTNPKGNMLTPFVDCSNAGYP
jgi:hypothetical protein